MNDYKLNRPNEFLTFPNPLERGSMTAANECAELVKKWASEVYHAWSSNHSLVSQIADGFLENIKKHDRKTTSR